MSNYWSIRQTAQHLGLSIKSVSRLIEKGDLEAIKLATRTIRVSEASIRELIEKRLGDSRRERGLDEPLEPGSGGRGPQRRANQ